MFEESSSSELRRMSEELARERAWNRTPIAAQLASFAAQLFDLANATEAWAARTAETWIATGTSEASFTTLQALTEQVAAVAAVVNAELN